MSGPTDTPDGAGPLIPSRNLDMSVNIDGPETADADPVSETVEREVPYDGVVTQVYIGVQDGVHSRVGFAIWDADRERKIFPFDEESKRMSFNDEQDFWPISFPVKEGDIIRIEYLNDDHHTDGHKITISPILVGIEALPGTLEDYAAREGIDL